MCVLSEVLDFSADNVVLCFWPLADDFVFGVGTQCHFGDFYVKGCALLYMVCSIATKPYLFFC